jgi:hypothetical protein
MIDRRIFAALGAVGSMGSVTQAQILPTHPILAALAVEAASETVGLREAGISRDGAGGERRRRGHRHHAWRRRRSLHAR